MKKVMVIVSIVVVASGATVSMAKVSKPQLLTLDSLIKQLQAKDLICLQCGAVTPCFLSGFSEEIGYYNNLSYQGGIGGSSKCLVYVKPSSAYVGTSTKHNNVVVTDKNNDK